MRESPRGFLNGSLLAFLRIMKPTPQKTFSTFAKNYKEIPLVPVSKTPFQTLVAVMLSARTRDETTATVCRRLFKVAPTPQKLAKLEVGKIEKLIYPVGFYRVKAKQLRKLANVLVDNFDGKVPSTLKELTTLSGIGRKSANIVLARAFNLPAIGVDTHVHRISNLLGWVKTTTPEKTEMELMKVLPKKYWIDVNSLMVSIGQQYRSQRQLEKFLQKKNLLSNENCMTKE